MNLSKFYSKIIKNNPKLKEEFISALENSQDIPEIEREFIRNEIFEIKLTDVDKILRNLKEQLDYNYKMESLLGQEEQYGVSSDEITKLQFKGLAEYIIKYPEIVEELIQKLNNSVHFTHKQTE